MAGHKRERNERACFNLEDAGGPGIAVETHDVFSYIIASMHKLTKELSQNKTKECVFVGIHMFLGPIQSRQVKVKMTLRKVKIYLYPRT